MNSSRTIPSLVVSLLLALTLSACSDTATRSTGNVSTTSSTNQSSTSSSTSSTANQSSCEMEADGRRCRISCDGGLAAICVKSASGGPSCTCERK